MPVWFYHAAGRSERLVESLNAVSKSDHLFRPIRYRQRVISDLDICAPVRRQPADPMRWRPRQKPSASKT